MNINDKILNIITVLNKSKVESQNEFSTLGVSNMTGNMNKNDIYKQRKFLNNLHRNDINILNKYIESSYSINDTLRHIYLQKNNISESLNIHNKLKNIIERAPPLDHPLTVYKAAGKPYLELSFMKPGDIIDILYLPYVSTTTDKTILEDLIDVYFDSYIYLFKLPKGTKGLYIHNFDEYQEGTSEYEFLLPPGTYYKLLILALFLNRFNIIDIIKTSSLYINDHNLNEQLSDFSDSSDED